VNWALALKLRLSVQQAVRPEAAAWHSALVVNRPVGEVVALNAIRVALRRGRAKAGEEDNCRRRERKKYHTHTREGHCSAIDDASALQAASRFFAGNCRCKRDRQPFACSKRNTGTSLFA